MYRQTHDSQSIKIKFDKLNLIQESENGVKEVREHKERPKGVLAD